MEKLVGVGPIKYFKL